ncbi:MAG TPA: nucleoside triphosphate pyrophosphohydrolase [Negativicutes bacterium]|nr:nucleoside triphosphate pyrophosphohydrolase [Negativicutes bacterium]
MGEIVIIGLGPGDFGLITGQTLALLETRPALFLRTARHPAVAGLAERGIPFTSYDSFYEQHATFDAVYAAITADVVAKAGGAGRVVFAVPGSPAVAEKTVGLIRAAAEEAGISVTVLPAMSFLDLLYARLGLDPVEGLTVTDAAEIANLPPDLGTALVVTQVYNSRVASDAKLSLMDVYPDDYPVTVARNLGLADEEIRTVPLYELDRLPVIDHLTSVYVPAKLRRAAAFSLDPVIDIMARLRSPGGCVWDIEQSHRSLRRYIVEEVYEVLEAIDLADGDKLCEELGDLLLQIVFHARIAEEAGEFSMQDVVDVVTEKMVRRHPHVFGETTVRDAAEVIVNWEKIKRREHPGERPSVLDGVPKELPSLMRAYKLQAKAAKVGFDWNSVAPVWDKIYEELGELREAAAGDDAAAVEGELGDVLFSIVNLARFFDIEPETSLNVTNNKFIRRFAYIEAAVKGRGLKWKDFTLEQLDALWNEAKMPENEE